MVATVTTLGWWEMLLVGGAIFLSAQTQPLYKQEFIADSYNYSTEIIVGLWAGLVNMT